MALKSAKRKTARAWAIKTYAMSRQTILANATPSVFIGLLICTNFAAVFFDNGMPEHENLWALSIWVGATGERKMGNE